MNDSDYVKINSVNLFYITTDEVDGYIECNSTEEKNGNKYLTFASRDKSKEVLEKYIKLWDEIKYCIKTINGGECIESGKYGKKLPENQIQFRR